MFKHMRTQWDGLKQSASLCGRSSLYNLLTLGEHISILHMKNEIQIWPKCGAFAILVDLFSFLLQVFSKSSFLRERSPLQALSANIWGWRYFTCNNMFCLFLKECENTPVRIKSNNQGQSTPRWKSLGSELHLESASVTPACPNRSISPPSCCFTVLLLDSFVHMLLLPKLH